jgi:predicted NUDIX family phosphoesterase
MVKEVTKGDRGNDKRSKVTESETEKEILEPLTKDKEIMVVPKRDLFENNYFEGFMKKNSVDYEGRILSNFVYIQRSLAENSPEYKQPVGYAIIVNPKTKKIFVYQRAKDKNYNEKRLQGNWSWGLGGHIEKVDSTGSPIYTSILRELNEEVNIEDYTNPVVLGYINDDSNDVGKVHFGVLYVIETNFDVTPKDAEIASGKFMDINELEKICSLDQKIDSWSKISFAPLKEYLEKKTL